MKETAVGLLFFLFIGLLMYFTVVAKQVGIPGISTDNSYRFDVLFKDVEYLKKGHPVVFGGQQVGSVEAIGYDEKENRIRVTLAIDEIKIPRNAEITVVSSTLFGGKAVNISRPDRPKGGFQKFFDPNKTYNVGKQEKSLMKSLQKLSESLNKTVEGIQSNLTKTIENAQAATKSLAEVAEKINTGQGTLAKLVNDEEMGMNLKKVTTNLAEVTKKLAENQSTLGRLIGDPKMGQDVSNITANVSGITEKINNGTGTLGMLVNDSAVYQNLSRLTANVDTLVGKVLKGEGTIGKLFTDDRLYESLADVASNVRTITGDMVKQKGLLGRAVSDETMGDNFAKTLQNLKDASQSIKNIADKIDSGTGTLGDLVNNTELIDSAKSAIANLDKTLGKVARSQTIVGGGYFYTDEQKLTSVKGYLRIVPSRTRFFHVGATLFYPTEGGPITFDQQKVDDGKLILYPDVLLGKNWYFNDVNAESWDDLILTLRLGMLEGQVGGGVDIDFLDNFRISLEARYAHKDANKFHENINRYMARANISYRFFKYFRAYVGIDNFIENGALSFGVTAEWSDDDIKTLVSLVGAAN